jgi:hypothetical protein
VEIILEGEMIVIEEKIKIKEKVTVPCVTENEFMCEECGTRVDKLRNFCGFGICEECYIKLLCKNQHEV